MQLSGGVVRDSNRKALFKLLKVIAATALKNLSLSSSLGGKGGQELVSMADINGAFRDAADIRTRCWR